MNDFTTLAHPHLFSVLVLSSICMACHFLLDAQMSQRSSRGVNSGTVVSFLPQVGCSSCKDIQSPEFFYVHVITVLLIENIKHCLTWLFL